MVQDVQFLANVTVLFPVTSAQRIKAPMEFVHIPLVEKVTSPPTFFISLE